MICNGSKRTISISGGLGLLHEMFFPLAADLDCYMKCSSHRKDKHVVSYLIR